MSHQRETGSIHLHAASIRRSFNGELRRAVEPLITKLPLANRAYLLATNARHLLELIDVGSVATPLVRDNYSADVLAEYDHIASDLRDPTPCGRLVLLEGAPGTGKSHFVRGLAAAAPSVLVFIAPGLLGQISGPEVIPVLMRERDRACPILLVIEDADTALVKRGSDNLTILSELCNLSDGLLAEKLDIRIVATTNAKRVEIDDAALRAGRLCSAVSFRPLGRAHAEEVYRRLMGSAALPTDEENPTVADVYRLARRNTRGKVSGMSSTAVGFGRSSSAPE